MRSKLINNYAEITTTTTSHATATTTLYAISYAATKQRNKWGTQRIPSQPEQPRRECPEHCYAITTLSSKTLQETADRREEDAGSSNHVEPALIEESTSKEIPTVEESTSKVPFPQRKLPSKLKDPIGSLSHAEMDPLKIRHYVVLMLVSI